MGTILDRFRLDDTVAIVTGASSGLGVAVAQALAEAGADVVLAARRTRELEGTARLVEKAGRRALCVPTDVSVPEQCRQLAERAAGFGRVGVLVNNAGIGAIVPASHETPEQFRHVLDVNLMGAYWMAQAAASAMETGGSIVNISSVMASVAAGRPAAAYAASKAGLIGLTRDLATQWSTRKGIRVNAVAPGFYATELTAGHPAGYLEDRVANIPINRLGEPDELAAAVLFLSSRASSYVTGTVLTVDGGLLITAP